ncbi:hypothetical protein KGM_203749 [Danaus plexippus plexippus]|uniref:Uncharacterized protein n=1 Tax=Danaus plexippus plexippus TaxID=278856 RepID=A0A212ETA7_DANPL|nr:hypothetical protein KGM_203749 [Danaus plexippus plexippus]
MKVMIVMLLISMVLQMSHGDTVHGVNVPASTTAKSWTRKLGEKASKVLYGLSVIGQVQGIVQGGRGGHRHKGTALKKTT